MEYFLLNDTAAGERIVVLASGSEMNRSLLESVFLQDAVNLKAHRITVVGVPQLKTKELRVWLDELIFQMPNVKAVLCSDKVLVKSVLKVKDIYAAQPTYLEDMDKAFIALPSLHQIKLSKEVANTVSQGIQNAALTSTGGTIVSVTQQNVERIHKNTTFVYGIAPLRDGQVNPYTSSDITIGKSAPFYAYLNTRYPLRTTACDNLLSDLLREPVLSIDIETFSLNHTSAGIASISFTTKDELSFVFSPFGSWDFLDNPAQLQGILSSYHSFISEMRVFFEHFQGKMVFHNAAYDAKVLIYALFMKNIGDIEGMIKGLDLFRGRVHCTKIMSYICFNSTERVSLSLKDLAREYVGDYGFEADAIKDIRKIPINKLLPYNATDTAATNWLYHTKLPQYMAQGENQKIYDELMIPFLLTSIEAELVGAPINQKAVVEAMEATSATIQANMDIVKQSRYYQEAYLVRQSQKIAHYNATHKVKKHTTQTYPPFELSLGSDDDMRALFYNAGALPITELTGKKKEPSVSADTLKAYLSWDSVADDLKETIRAFLTVAKASKISSTFLPALSRALPHPDGTHRLFGNFNLTVTISGRLSSSNPNLQNMPSKGEYGKAIKKCFISPPNMIMGGADFSSLEDYISALQTKDPNKIKVYLDLYDGHCLRAFYYFRDEMPDILETVESINSIKKLYPTLRDLSKGPTFALTYQGDSGTLQRNLGWSKEKADRVEANYKELYKVSIQWVDTKLNQAQIDGYVTLAFGMRLHTPAIHNSHVVYKSRNAVQAERRSAGNALGQSYCMLNSRAAMAFMNRVWDTPGMRYRVFPIMFIHDAIYLIWDNDPEVTKFVNDNLIQEMRWQELPDIQHDTVKIGAELDVFYPNWSTSTTLKNDIPIETIKETHAQLGLVV